MVKINLGVVVLLSVFAIIGSFFSTIVFHEVTHVYQSNNPLSLSYDMLQPTFTHVLHDVKSWENNNAFINFVKHTEFSADLTQEFFGYIMSFLIGTCTFALVFKRLDEENIKSGF